MSITEGEIRRLLKDPLARVTHREDIPLPQESVAAGLQTVSGEFSRWLEEGAPGAPLVVRSEMANRLAVDLHRYPRVDVLEVLDRRGRTIEFETLRGAPEFGRVGAAQSLAYLRHAHEGDACALRVGQNTVVIERSGAFLHMLLVQGSQHLPCPAADSVAQWAERSASAILRGTVARRLTSTEAWDVVVAAALLAFVGGLEQPVRIRSVEDLKAVRLAEPRPVEWIRSLEASDVMALEAHHGSRVEALRRQLLSLSELDDRISRTWCAAYAQCASRRADAEVVAWLLSRHPASQRPVALFGDVDRLGEMVRPVLEELVVRDPIVATVARNDPGSWWDAGTLPDEPA